MKRDKALIVTVVGLFLALVIALLNYFEPFAEESAAFTAWLIISPIWLFCTAPAYVAVFGWINNSLNKYSDEEAMRRSILLGALYGTGLLVLPLISAPFWTVVYYVKVFKKKG